MTYAELKRRNDILKANVKHLDRENELLKANLEATKDILLETESELNLATGKIEGYRECLRILRGGWQCRSVTYATPACTTRYAGTGLPSSGGGWRTAYTTSA